MHADRLNILIVSAQFPFPARSGFARRVAELAGQLASRHDVTLLSYARPGERDGATGLCEGLSVEIVERDQTSLGAKRTGQLLSMASRRPYCGRAVHSTQMQRAIDRLCSRRSFDVAQLESSLLCAFAFPRDVRLVLDEHNIEYEVFDRVREAERSAARRSFNRLESARFRRYEQRWWARVDGCVVTSEREERIVSSYAPHTPAAVVPNGVDLDVFRPAAARPEPRTLLFNGVLDYRPNLDAAYHLVDEIWPLVVRGCPGARLEIVGRGEAADLRRLRRPGVDVTGEVPDLRPYLERASVVAIPIRMGGGTRLKVVEGLAMGKAMVSTTLGCEGIAVHDGEHLLIADGAEPFASSVLRLFAEPRLGETLGRAGRALAERRYSWDLAGERLNALHRRVTSSGRDATAPLASAGGPSWA